MAELTVDITPPRKELTDLSPSAFFEHEHLISALKRKTGLPITPTTLKRFKFCPEVQPSDTTVTGYLDCKADTLTKGTPRLTLTTPFDSIRKQIQAQTKEKSSLKESFEVVQAQLVDLASTFKQYSASKEIELEELHKTQIRLREIDKRRLLFFAANLLTTVLQKISTTPGLKDHQSDGANLSSHSSTRYAKVAESLDKKTFVQKTGLSQACFKILKRYPQYIQDRNAAAHETQEDFADLLMSEEYKGGNMYYQWEKLFKFEYDKTVEEVYAASEEKTRLLMTGTG
ncbi:hypothetical protein MMC30_000202 [Trapelia coarctata]|nr:hypothetical protein [Trapelia coarctata]